MTKLQAESIKLQADSLKHPSEKDKPQEDGMTRLQ
jgi:hypothetical protein